MKLIIISGVREENQHMKIISVIEISGKRQRNEERRTKASINKWRRSEQRAHQRQ